MSGTVLFFQVIRAIMDRNYLSFAGSQLTVSQRSYCRPRYIGRSSESYRERFVRQLSCTVGKIMLEDKDSSRALFYFS